MPPNQFAYTFSKDIKVFESMSVLIKGTIIIKARVEVLSYYTFKDTLIATNSLKLTSNIVHVKEISSINQLDSNHTTASSSTIINEDPPP